MRMDLAGEKFQVEADYQVMLPPGNHLIVIAGTHLGTTGLQLRPPQCRREEERTVRVQALPQGGGKFWTSRPGIDFYFVLPKAQIELLPEKGYSYVPVLIRGRKCRLERQWRRAEAAAGPITSAPSSISAAVGR